MSRGCSTDRPNRSSCSCSAYFPLCALLCRSEASASTACSIDQEQILLPLDENERVLGMQMALKCADVGHVTAALPVHIRCVVVSGGAELTAYFACMWGSGCAFLVGVV